MKYLANTNKQSLINHLSAVSKVSGMVYDELFNGNGKKDCEMAGLLHDIGKIDNNFQEWINKKINGKKQIEDNYHNENSVKKFENIIRHNELSWAISELIPNISDNIKYAILWHHAEKFRKHPVDSAKTIYSENFDEILNNVCKLLLEIDINNINKKNQRDIKLPKFKNINKINGRFKCEFEENIKNTITRLCLVIADRIVSSLTEKELENIINRDSWEDILPKHSSNNNLNNNIEQMLNEFDKYGNKERNNEQQIIAKKCSDIDGSVVLQGPAGVGKTKVSFEWAKNINADKIIYVCPRVSICLGLYNDIKTEYLPNTEVQIFTGEYKLKSQNNSQIEINDDQFLESDVNITTIDQIISMLTRHNKLGLIYNFIKSAVIIDEFHEVIKTPAIAVYLKEIIGIRNIAKNSKTLFMSATPNLPLLNYILGKDSRPYMIKMKSFHNKLFDINIINDESENETDHPFLNIEATENSFIISNNICIAQIGFLRHIVNEKHKVLVVHSAYSKQHRDKLFKKIFDSFGVNGNKSIKCLRSGPIIQASLNISANKIYTDVSSPEDLLQRLGRCNRFCENDIGELFIYKTSKNKSVKKYIETNYCSNSSKLFLEYLENKYSKKFKIKLDDIYNDYFEFYNKYHKECIIDIKKFEQKAYEQLYENDFFRPLDFFQKNKKIDKNKLANKSLRGSSIYVIPTLSTIINDKEYKEKEWLYNPKKINEHSLLLSMDINNYKLHEILDIFKNKVKHKNHLYGDNNYYNKHNTKYTNFIVKSAKLPEKGVFIGDLSGTNTENFDYKDHNFTYIFNEDYKQNIISVGLIDKQYLTKLMKDRTNE